MSRTIFYARVSTTDQTLTHQRTHAEAAGFIIDDVVEDDGVSGFTPLAERPGGALLLRILRPEDTLICRWVDRLGRNYDDASDTIRDLMRRGVVVKTVINNMTFDGATKDPVLKAVRDSLIAFMSATAQAQAEATKAAQRAGIELARTRGAFLGRKPSFTRTQFDSVRLMLDRQTSICEIARSSGLTRQTIYRIQKDSEAQESALAAWENRGC